MTQHWFDEKKLCIHFVEIMGIFSRLTLFSQKIRESNCFKEVTTAQSWFHEIKFWWVRENFLFFHTLWQFYSHSVTVWKNAKFSLTKRIFREINSLVTSLVKPLISRNFCQKVWERISVISTRSAIQTSPFGFLFFEAVIMNSIIFLWVNKLNQTLPEVTNTLTIFWGHFWPQKRLILVDFWITWKLANWKPLVRLRLTYSSW